MSESLECDVSCMPVSEGLIHMAALAVQAGRVPVRAHMSPVAISGLAACLGGPWIEKVLVGSEEAQIVARFRALELVDGGCSFWTPFGKILILPDPRADHRVTFYDASGRIVAQGSLPV